MRALIIFLISIISCCFCHAQAEYFNVQLYDSLNIASPVGTVEFTGDSYVVNGRGSTNGTAGYKLYEVDLMGQQVSALAQFDFSTTDGYAECFRKVTGGFTHSAASSNGEATFYKFNDDGVIEWVYSYPNCTELFTCEYQIHTETSTGDFILAGHGDYGESLLITKLNATGEHLWTTEQDIFSEDNQFLRVNGIHELDNGGFFLTAGVFQPWDKLLIKTNENGIIENMETDIYRWGNPEVSDWLPWAVKGENENEFVIAHPVALEWVDFSETTVTSRLGIFSFNISTMSIVETSELTEPYDDIYMVDMLRTPDSGYAILWQEWTGSPERSFIKKFDSELEVEWQKSYMHSETTDATNRLWDFDLTPDGGFICAGSAAGIFTDVEPTRHWLLKLDACGDMEWQGCDTTTVGINEPPTEIREVRVYPNPALNQLYVDLSLLRPAKTAEIVISDLLGRTIITTSISSLKEQTIDIETLKPGLYNLSVIDMNEVISNEQFVKE